MGAKVIGKGSLPLCTLVGLLFVLSIHLATSSDLKMSDQHQKDKVELAHSLEKFGMNLYHQFTDSDQNRNVIFSPFSIHTCVAMARMGAEGLTAKEMDNLLGFKSMNRDVTEYAPPFYHDILKNYENSSILNIANRIYVMENYTIQEEFGKLLTDNFFSSAVSINFAENIKAANTINEWVEQRTNNRIKDLINPSFLDENSRIVLLNAIHFKGEWQTPFPKVATMEKNFFVNETDSVRVQMMHLRKHFRYGHFRELDAAALEIPYSNSDLVMLVLLPNSRTGLKKLEAKLPNYSISDLMHNMHETEVLLDLPKFKAEFQMELSDVFRQLGASRMFSDIAEFGQMLKEKEPLKVTKVIHKAFIEVNEEGTEAAAATAVIGAYITSLGPQSLPQIFKANRPFFYMIVSKNDRIGSEIIPLFQGNVQF